jgi:hypothetical protein
MDFHQWISMDFHQWIHSWSINEYGPLPLGPFLWSPSLGSMWQPLGPMGPGPPWRVGRGFSPRLPSHSDPLPCIRLANTGPIDL